MIENIKPTSCPICKTQSFFTTTGVDIADGIIYRCKTCYGYFLYPEQSIVYDDSDWSLKREKNWENDVKIAKIYTPKIKDYAEKILKNNIRSVLEIGCGSGFMGLGFNSIGCEYTGIDVDKYSIEKAKEKDLNVYTIETEKINENTELNKKNFDIVISSNVFEHLNDPLKAFANLRDITKGIFIIVVPNAHGFMAVLKKNRVLQALTQKILGNKRRIIYSIDGYWHNIAYTKNTLKYLCRKTGLEIIELKTMGINDPVFGFVQPNASFVYKLISFLAGLVGMESELLLIGRVKENQGNL